MKIYIFFLNTKSVCVVSGRLRCILDFVYWADKEHSYNYFDYNYYSKHFSMLIQPFSYLPNNGPVVILSPPTMKSNIHPWLDKWNYFKYNKKNNDNSGTYIALFNNREWQAWDWTIYWYYIVCSNNWCHLILDPHTHISREILCENINSHAWISLESHRELFKTIQWITHNTHADEHVSFSSACVTMNWLIILCLGMSHPSFWSELLIAAQSTSIND